MRRLDLLSANSVFKSRTDSSCHMYPPASFTRLCDFQGATMVIVLAGPLKVTISSPFAPSILIA